MNRKVLSLLLLLLLMATLVTGTVSVLATQVVQYDVPVYVTNNSTTGYTNLPVVATVNNTAMVAGGFMGPQGLDARELLAGSSQPMLLADNKTVFFIPAIGALSQVNLNFTTGSSNLTSMPIVLGNGGLVTTTDNPSLEIGTNGAVSGNGTYIDTSTSGTVFSKANSLSFIKGGGNLIVTAANSTQLNYTAASTQYCHKDAGVVFPAGTTLSIDACSSRNTTGVQQFIFSSGVIGATSSWYVLFSAGNNIQIVGSNTTAGGTAVSWTSTNTTTFGVAYYITFTYNSAAATRVNVYVNGSNWGGVDAGSGGPIGVPTTFLGIGGGYNGAWVTTMNGGIDEVRISSTVRTLAEHQYAYNSGSGIPFITDASTVSLWHFSEGGGATTNDETGNNNLALVNNPFWARNSPVSTAAFVAKPSGVYNWMYSINATSSQIELWLSGVLSASTLLNGSSIPNTTNNYVFMQNVPYTGSLSITVSGIQQVVYQPVTIISGTTMPNLGSLGATGNGVITWGTNPTGVVVTWGVMTSSGAPAVATTTPAPIESLPQTSGQSNWFGAPNLARLATNPVRPFVLIISDNVNLSEASAWQWLGFAFVLFCTMLTAVSVKGHLMIAGIAAAASMGLLIQQTIWPLWSLVFVVMALIAGLIAERMPWV